MFKFNFDSEDAEVKDSHNAESNEVSWDPFREVSYTDEFNIPAEHLIKLKCKDFEFQVVDASKSPESLMQVDGFDGSIFQSLQASHSDLLTAQYEGGFKIWECTYDLLNYFIDNEINLKNKTVLDLGCGVGVLGMYCLQKGAIVHFQDYNVDVLKYATIPSVFSSCGVAANCKFFAGDWSYFCEENPSIQYDFVFSSETIYNPRNYDKLCLVFEKKLKSSGVGLLAAKSFYFGVGGSTLEFQKKLESSSKLTCAVIWKFSNGLQREIIKISHQS